MSYKNRVLEAIDGNNFEPYMTLFYQNYDTKFLKDIQNDITAIKLYPAGITTNSKQGVSNFDIKELEPTLSVMSELDIPLCVHGETDGFVMDRESQFMDIYEQLATNFPKLNIIMEHITTKDATKIVQKYDNLYATITAHHLLITLDDVAGGFLDPHLFCKPIAKRYEDKEALVKLATSGNKKVMFGSDSAPHPTHKKECCGCAAGVFTAPIALQLLCELFIKDEQNINLQEQNLQKFLSSNAVDIYGLTPPNKTITLREKNYKVAVDYKNTTHTITPMYGGKTIKWSII